MRITADLTNDEIEKLYFQLGDDLINLPRGFKNLRLGLLPRLSQFFITALKRDKSTSIKFPQLEVENMEGIEELLQDPQLLSAILMAENVFGKDIKTNTGKEKIELKSKINKQIQNRLNESIYKRGHRVQMLAVDHSNNNYANPSCFYTPEGSDTLKQSEYYSSIIERFLSSVSKLSTLTQYDYSKLGELIFELIENTDQHGKQDYENGYAERSVRGLILDYKLVTENAESENIGGVDTIITDYLNGLRKKNRTQHLLEISIFDSGEGIAKGLSKTLSKNIDAIDEEANLISLSFTKGVTSKADDLGYGRGLHNVKNVLNDRNGFISVRTGRVSLFRDFNLNSLTDLDADALALFDETNKTTKTNYKELGAVEGLACSILVPLK